MSKICFIGDLHIGCRNSNQHLQNLFENFYTKTFFPYLIGHNIKHVVQLGDLFDSRKVSNHNSLYEARRFFFSKFDAYDIQLYTLLGNHDIAFKESLKVSSSDLFLSQFKNIKIISEPSTINIKFPEHDLTIDTIPWICSENYDNCLEYIENSTADICVGHFEISGFKMYKGSISSDHGLSKELFSKYEMVLSGHYHHRSKKGNIEYIGTPYEMTWHDYDDTKGFYVYDSESRVMEFIENPYTIFIKVDYDDSGLSVDEFTEKYLTEEFLWQFSVKYVKIEVIHKNNPYLFDMFIDQVNLQNPISVSIVEELLNIDVEDSVNETDDTLTITYKYIDSVNAQELDKNKLKSIMSDLYNDAMAVE